MHNVIINPELEKLLRGVAKNNELNVGFADKKYPTEILKVWFTNIQRIGVTNYLVVALDDDDDDVADRVLRCKQSSILQAQPNHATATCREACTFAGFSSHGL